MQVVTLDNKLFYNQGNIIFGADIHRVCSSEEDAIKILSLWLKPSSSPADREIVFDETREFISVFEEFILKELLPKKPVFDGRDDTEFTLGALVGGMWITCCQGGSDPKFVKAMEDYYLQLQRLVYGENPTLEIREVEELGFY